MSVQYSTGRQGYDDRYYDDGGGGGVDAYPDNRYPTDPYPGNENDSRTAMSRSQEYFPDDYGEYDDDQDRRRRPLSAEELEFERQKRLDHFEVGLAKSTLRN